MADDLGTRISLLEERVNRLETEVSNMSTKLDGVATKADLTSFSETVQVVFKEVKDAVNEVRNNLWKLVFGLTTIIAILAGVKQIVEIFG